MKCSICNKEGGMLVPHVNAETHETHHVCMECLADKSAEQELSLEELDEAIADYEDMLAKLEGIVKDFPKDQEAPQGLEGFAFTPMAMYESSQKMLARLKTKRLKKLIEGGSKKTLEYELKIAIEKEEFEKAAEIKIKLSKLD